LNFSFGRTVGDNDHAHTLLRYVCTGYRDSVFQTRWILWLSILASTASPRTYSASLCMYGVTEIASSRRMGHGLSILASPASPRTYYAPLRMYGVTEIASSRRMGHGLSILTSLASPASPAHTTLRMYGVTEIASSRRMGAWALYPHIPASPASPRTYYAPLRMYGVAEIASSRRIKQKRHQIALMPFYMKKYQLSLVSATIVVIVVMVVRTLWTVASLWTLSLNSLRTWKQCFV